MSAFGPKVTVKMLIFGLKWPKATFNDALFQTDIPEIGTEV